MKTIFKNNLNVGKETNLVVAMTFILLLFCNIKVVGQEQTKRKVVPAIAVKFAFEKDFPNEVPEWTKDFGGDDLNQIRYTAKFKTKTSQGLAVYDNSGALVAYEILILKKDIPINIVNYLNKNYENFIIREASKVKNDKNETTFEIGIIRDEKFYDVIFDNNTNFIEIIQKD